jgi:signal transduction histidine kinase
MPDPRCGGQSPGRHDCCRIAATGSRRNAPGAISLPGPDDELKALGDTLGDLFDRLGASFGAQRHFVAKASHELRTPLTADPTLLQVALDPSRKYIRAQEIPGRMALGTPGWCNASS